MLGCVETALPDYNRILTHHASNKPFVFGYLAFRFLAMWLAPLRLRGNFYEGFEGLAEATESRLRRSASVGTLHSGLEGIS